MGGGLVGSGGGLVASSSRGFVAATAGALVVAGRGADSCARGAWAAAPGVLDGLGVALGSAAGVNVAATRARTCVAVEVGWEAEPPPIQPARSRPLAKRSAAPVTSETPARGRRRSAILPMERPCRLAETSLAGTVSVSGIAARCTGCANDTRSGVPVKSGTRADAERDERPADRPLIKESKVAGARRDRDAGHAR